MKRVIALGICFLMLFSVFAIDIFAAEDVKTDDNASQVELTFSNSMSYEGFLEKYKDSNKPLANISIDIKNYTASADCEVKLLDNYNGKNGASLYIGEEGSISFEVDVKEKGLYAIKTDFYVENSRGALVERKIKINGEYQHESAENINFNRIYIDDPESIGKIDYIGNDIRPSQVEEKIWQYDQFIRDKDFYVSPMLFYFEAGKNVLTLENVSEPITISNLSITNSAESKSYEDVYAEYKKSGLTSIENGDPIIIQAEKAKYKSDIVLYPIVDRTTPSTVPYEQGLEKLNSIGGYRWQSAGQFLVWEFEVEKDGLYTIYIKSRQNVSRGVISNRAIYIDNTIPFVELEDYDFPYSKDWNLAALGEEKPYQIYLTKGTHELKIEANLGETSEKVKYVQSILEELNSIYTKILTITGSKPDTMRDYYLDDLIPEEIVRLGELADELQKVVDWYQDYSDNANSMVATINTIIRQLHDFKEKPDLIAKNLNYFKTNLGSLGAWLITAQEQPLELDYVAFGGTDDIDNLPKANASFGEKIKFDVLKFLSSFSADYASVGSENISTEGYKSIKVWTSLGRDQAQAIRKIIDSTFTTDKKINVNLELVNGGALLPATVAGIGPDVALNMGETEPVNYAVRNAVIDLTKFEDYEEIAKRFLPERMIPISFDNKVYALPETQSFNVMFYRKDVLSNLGIEIPQTWEDVISVISVLQKSKMSFAVPVSTTAAPQSGVSTYYTLLFQQDGTLYNNNGESSALDSEVSLSSFKEWTNLYINYDLPKEYNFLDRFRTGEYPLIIGDFGHFNSLIVSAPEIRGLWGFTLIPGTLREDGVIDRSTPIGGTNCFILKNSNNYNESWEFIKWWTSADTQVAYGTEMESILGASARYATANLEAFEKIPWSTDFYKVLKEQMLWGKGIEQVPGSYFTARHLNNAFRKVVISSQEPKDTLFDYVYTINQELTSKREEFGME